VATYEQLEAMSQRAARNAARYPDRVSGSNPLAPFMSTIAWKANMQNAIRENQRREDWWKQME